MIAQHNYHEMKGKHIRSDRAAGRDHVPFMFNRTLAGPFFPFSTNVSPSFGTGNEGMRDMTSICRTNSAKFISRTMQSEIAERVGDTRPVYSAW